MIILHQTIDPLFIDYCTYFNGDKDYFECHEVLEELWKEIAPGDKQHALVGLIQVATALYHWRRNNYSGAQKTLSSSIRILQQQGKAPYFSIIDHEKLLNNCDQSLTYINAKQPFTAFSLHFLDAAFAEMVSARIMQLPTTDEHFIMNKHTLRDRSHVINQRTAQLAKKIYKR